MPDRPDERNREEDDEMITLKESVRLGYYEDWLKQLGIPLGSDADSKHRLPFNNGYEKGFEQGVKQARHTASKFKSRCLAQGFTEAAGLIEELEGELK